MGGLLVYNNKIIGTMFGRYSYDIDPNGVNTIDRSHFTHGLNL